VRELSRLFGADRRTVARWQEFWRERFPQLPFWRAARGRLAPIVELITLPRSLLEAFVSDGRDQQGWGKLLRFLAPITIAGSLVSNLS
jgi:hypothetical protein